MSETTYIYPAKELLKLEQFKHILNERRLNYWSELKGLPFMQPGGSGCLRFYDVREIENFIKGKCSNAENIVTSSANMLDRRMACGGKGLAAIKPKAPRTKTASIAEGGA